MAEKANAKIIADSLNTATGDRLTTFLLLRFPKCLFAQLAKHGIFSHNAPDEGNPGSGFTNSAASSRAIPTKKLIKRIKEDPYIPTWTLKGKGMQGPLADAQASEDLTKWWLNGLDNAIASAEQIAEIGHKQDANRLLEPWLRMPVLVSATAWGNFFKLRAQPDKPLDGGFEAQPAFRQTALEMFTLLNSHSPKELHPGEWHLPFSDQMHRDVSLADKVRVSSARSARLSYASHDGDFSLEKDLELYNRLFDQGHLEPLQHAAIAVAKRSLDIGSDAARLPGRVSMMQFHTRNYRGFLSHRAAIEQDVELF